MNNDKHIKTFKDDVCLRLGEKITPALVGAIEASSTYVVIFSPNYATSHWCLDELVKILECAKEYGRVMIPVFYGGVTPSHVRNQEASFAAAFAGLKEKYPQARLDGWKVALKDAAQSSGVDSQVTTYKSEMVRKITKRVLEAIRPGSSHITQGLVGIEPEIEAVEKLLDTDDTQKRRIIGFWGMPGIGKTTLANAIYHKIDDQNKSERCHFVREMAGRLKKSKTVTELKTELFDALLGEESSQISPGMQLLRLSRTRAFVVIDDLTSLQLLEELLQMKFWEMFGPGSRIILTSTNQKVLKHDYIDAVYQVQGLDREEALKLFSLYAFEADQPPAEYKEMCDKVVGYCGGNPLALRVLGRMFHGTERRFWDSVMEKLRTLYRKEILDVLKISYDELNRDEQSAFLDVACFFNYDEYEFVTRVLDEDLVSNLVDKCLLGVNNNYSRDRETIEMHTLLEDLGKYIVREEKIVYGKQSRLWEVQESLDLLAGNMGAEATEGILLNLAEKEVEIKTEYSDPFAKMWSLRLLSIERAPDSKVVFPQGEGLINATLPRKLVYLRWDMFAASSLPSKFSPEKLRVLWLKHNSIHQLWEGANVVDLGDLRELNLTASKHLTKLPDLSTATKLELVDLTSCETLIELHTSIIYLPSLKTLILDSCKALDLSSLDKEDTQGNIVAFPRLEQVNLDATPIEEVPRLLVRAPNLTKIDCSACPNLSKFPSIDDLAGSLSIRHLIFRNNKLLVDFPGTIYVLKSLQTLDFYGCENLEEFPEISGPMEGLLVLDLSYCSKISRIPNTIWNLVNLERFCLSGSGIKEIPMSILSLKRLTVLKFDNCKKLVRIPLGFSELSRLETLELDGCDMLRNKEPVLPESIKKKTKNDGGGDEQAIE